MYIMEPGQEVWEDFCDMLEGPDACDFKKDKDGQITWLCHNDHKFARKILKDMGADVEGSIDFFKSHGGYCDCEILFNVAR